MRLGRLIHFCTAQALFLILSYEMVLRMILVPGIKLGLTIYKGSTWKDMGYHVLYFQIIRCNFIYLTWTICQNINLFWKIHYRFNVLLLINLFLLLRGAPVSVQGFILIFCSELVPNCGLGFMQIRLGVQHLCCEPIVISLWSIINYFYL